MSLNSFYCFRMMHLFIAFPFNSSSVKGIGRYLDLPIGVSFAVGVNCSIFHSLGAKSPRALVA